MLHGKLLPKIQIKIVYYSETIRNNISFNFILQFIWFVNIELVLVDIHIPLLPPQTS